MITLLTDFGAADYFVPAVKGVILTLSPAVQIVDITHEINAQDIASAAFTLGACYANFPPGTIHVAVVDPGVGSERRGIVVDAGGYRFVGPDNGIFSYACAREKDVRVHALENSAYFRSPVSATFHGRDVFAPVAAHLSLGKTPASCGSEIHDYVTLDCPRPHHDERRGGIIGRIIHIDRFGNCVTNFTEREFRLADPVPRISHTPLTLHLAGHEITQFGTHYAQAERKQELFAYLGSAGYWEIGLWCASAAALTGARRGTEALLKLS